MNSILNTFAILILSVLFFTEYGDLKEDYTNNSAWQYLPKDCGKSRYDNKTTRIINGDVARLGEFPWMVRLGRYLSNEKLSFFCGGVLINRFYVVTAAHCEEKAYLVRLGEHDTHSNTDCDETGDCAPPHQDIKVGMYYFENFCRPARNDLMVLELAEPAVFNEFVQPACIPRQPIKREELAGSYLTLTGWGSTNNNYSGPSRNLSYIVLEVQNTTKCEKIFSSFREGQICVETNDKGQNICKGDSGGPAFKSIEVDGVRRAYVFGVASYVLPKCTGGAVYTNIVYYMRSILRAVRKG